MEAKQCDERVRWELSLDGVLGVRTCGHWTDALIRVVLVSASWTGRVAPLVDAADELGTVLFGYARSSHIEVDSYSHWSRDIDMDGRGSPFGDHC